VETEQARTGLIHDIPVKISKLGKHPTDIESITAVLNDIAKVHNGVIRESLLNKFIAETALKKSVVEKQLEKFINASLEDKRRADRQEQQAAIAATPVNPAELFLELRKFFADRLYLPDGADLVLTLWVLMTHTFDGFRSIPYLLLESATPQCGKTTRLEILEVLCANTRRVAALTPAVLCPPSCRTKQSMAQIMRKQIGGLFTS
jgi:hypothetical protein